MLSIIQEEVAQEEELNRDIQEVRLKELVSSKANRELDPSQVERNQIVKQSVKILRCSLTQKKLQKIRNFGGARKIQRVSKQRALSPQSTSKFFKKRSEGPRNCKSPGPRLKRNLVNDTQCHMNPVCNPKTKFLSQYDFRKIFRSPVKPAIKPYEALPEVQRLAEPSAPELTKETALRHRRWRKKNLSFQSGSKDCVYLQPLRIKPRKRASNLVKIPKDLLLKNFDK
ncbi:unnamed protein product [Moneuplotes crassus]|uniref:Uncharacterized protein n=1 Tax=Euplotes crassus TaxID=5936 RepID=A0AAD1XG20_EUPCR|nr:unnamed protein product [Moneuplotes crassus]